MKDSCLIVEDDLDFAEFLTLTLKKLYSVVKAQTLEDASNLIFNQKFDLIICDYRLWGSTSESLVVQARNSSFNKYTPIIILSSLDDLQTVINLFDLGIDDFISKSVEIDELLARIKAAKRVRDLYFYADKLEKENERLKKLSMSDQLIGESQRFIEAVELCKKVSGTDAPILLLGETGVGKDVLAQKIHTWSGRAGSFISINIAALPKDLIESELFGYEKGAFSGAYSSKPGLIELADRGTLFINEIGEMPVDLQPKLLQVLQDKKVRRLGGIKEIPVDFRLISATCKKLDECVKNKTFREDLYYRINLVTCYIPPLRERAGDIVKLANHFLKLAEFRFNLGSKIISQRCLNSLISYRWPGNIRELENVIYRFYLTSDSNIIDFEIESCEDIPQSEFDLESRINIIEKSLFQEALQASKGNKSKAARLLGISRVTLNQKLKKYGLHWS